MVISFFDASRDLVSGKMCESSLMDWLLMVAGLSGTLVSRGFRHHPIPYVDRANSLPFQMERQVSVVNPRIIWGHGVPR